MHLSDHARRRIAPVALLAALGIAGCAAEPPTAEIASARAAISRATADGAPQLAPAPLQSAQSKLSQAQAQANSNDSSSVEQARRLAQQSEVDANLAAATARSQRAETTATDLGYAHSVLRQEPAQPPSPSPAPAR